MTHPTDLTHTRTVNGGTPQLITTRAAIAEIETVMNAGHDDGTEMYGSGSTYAITYADGRRVDIRPATEADLTAAGPADEKQANLRTHTGTVHAPGRYSKRLRTNIPACCASESAVARFHYVIPTSDPVTCQRCPAQAA